MKKMAAMTAIVALISMPVLAAEQGIWFPVPYGI